MIHYKCWEDEDGYVRAATWDDAVNAIKKYRYDAYTETKCGSNHLYHGGVDAAKEAFAGFPAEEVSEDKFQKSIAPFTGFKRLGSMEI